MADNLIQKSHKTSEKNKYNNVVHRTTSESLRLNESEKGVTHPTSLQSAHNPRKISSFQITSVTVGSRVSTDAGEDSADDLDESHTDDISRVTDIENETPSYSEDTFSKDDVFYNASSTSLGCAPVIPTSSQYGLAIVGQENSSNQVGANTNTEANDMHVSVTNAGSGSIINLIGNAKPQEGMKEIQEHVRNERFKVVKIESTEPFRRGRWMCMDYLDHTTTQQNPPISLNNNLDVIENNLQAPDSGCVINDNQYDDMCNDKGPKDQQSVQVQQIEQNVQKQFPMASPGQSLTQPINIVQQQMPVNQAVSVQSPPLEIPQQMQGQNLQTTQQVGQQHPQSMTHITMQNTAQNHPQPTQQQQVQQIPQSFPQHQLQQVIAQSQGIAMQQIPMHQQMPQQMQQIPNQQMQQIGQHLPQAQITNMQIQQPLQQMQGMPNQGQLTQVAGQQPQMQQLQMQQMQSQPNPQIQQQQNYQMQQAQIPNMGQGHHLQQQQPMGPQQAQLQHLSSQAQMQALQNQQIPNHMQQMQIPTQIPNQQMTQMQTQMHQLPSQAQQSVVPGMHPQMQQQGMAVPQPQYNQAVNQQANQSMIGASISSSQQPMVQTQHNVPQYHTQQSQIPQHQQGQTLPQEVLSSIVTSQQGATLPSNLQPMVSQPQGTTLQTNLQSLPGQQQAPVHTMAAQQGNVPQGNIQIMTQQNMQMALDGNQPSMQIPGSDPIYMQQANVGQQLPAHMAQPQNMLQTQVSGQGQMGGVQYVPNQSVPQVTMAHQNIPMSMQQAMPVGMGSGVHANVVQSQTNMGLTYGGVVPVMSQGSVASVEAAVSGTNSPVVSMPVSSTAYVTNTAQPGLDSQGFGSPVSAVVSHAISGAVNVNCDSAPDAASEGMQAGDTADGKEDSQPTSQPEDERSARETYGDEAVGYVQLKRDQQMCIVKCKLCPEHKVRSKPYSCTLIVDEQEEEVKSVACHDCPASEGGCKHAVAFLMWCHRRSEDPPCTAIECYWRKSTLSKVGSSIKILKCKDISRKRKFYPPTDIVADKSVFENFVAESKKRKITSCQLLKHETDYIERKVNTLSLHYLMCKFNTGLDCDSFFNNISGIFNAINIKNVEKETRHQHKSGLWYELRYGRITASKCYDVSRCQTADGSLVAAILGARTLLTSAMKRGQVLEEKVRKAVKKKLGHKIENCGLFISEDLPMIAGSPDGIYKKSTLVEIKCPTSAKTYKSYIKDGAVTKKYMAQVQMQMFCAKADKSYFCVASTDFETDNVVNIVEVQYNENYVKDLLINVISFWKKNIYPVLFESTRI